MKSKKEEFKKLFYSNLTEAEIKEVLNINYREYRQLLKEVKKELGLPSNYRRQPKRYWEYTEDSYYILKRDRNEDFEILCYCPTKELAEIKLSKLSLEEDCTYEINKANDKNLMNLIYTEYYINGNNWEGIIKKCKLPYHKFYDLLSIIKAESGNSNIILGNKRFIYEYSPTKKFVVKKYVHGKYVNFGYYDDVDIAIHVRNYLESINWNFNLWKNNKTRVVGEAVK